MNNERLTNDAYGGGGGGGEEDYDDADAAAC